MIFHSTCYLPLYQTVPFWSPFWYSSTDPQILVFLEVSCVIHISSQLEIIFLKLISLVYLTTTLPVRLWLGQKKPFYVHQRRRVKYREQQSLEGLRGVKVRKATTDVLSGLFDSLNLNRQFSRALLEVALNLTTAVTSISNWLWKMVSFLMVSSLLPSGSPVCPISYLYTIFSRARESIWSPNPQKSCNSLRLGSFR